MADIRMWRANTMTVIYGEKEQRDNILEGSFQLKINPKFF